MYLLTLSAIAVSVIPAAKIAVAGVFYVDHQSVVQASRARIYESFSYTFNFTDQQSTATSNLLVLTTIKDYSLQWLV